VVHSFPDVLGEPLSNSGNQRKNVCDTDIVVAFALPFSKTHPLHAALSSPTYGDHWHHHPFEPSFAEGLYYQIFTGRHSSFREEAAATSQHAPFAVPVVDDSPQSQQKPPLSSCASIEKELLIDLQVRTRYCLRYQRAALAAPFAGSSCLDAYSSCSNNLAPASPPPLPPVQRYHPLDVCEESLTHVRTPGEQTRRILQRSYSSPTAVTAGVSSAVKTTPRPPSAPFMSGVTSADHYFAPLLWPLYETSLDAAVFVTLYRKLLLLQRE
jgi:hypothetical protein